jgi:CheY-like chemotaxis protein
MLADIHGLFYERAREKQIEISYKVAPSVPDILIGDPTRLNQVITNLVNNALKFTEKGGVSIGVKTSQTASGMKLHVDVTDTGIGIAADKLALVFERFAQADQTISRRFGGTGLGLAISRRLVEAMGGEISVSSREGEGSNFAFDVAVDTEQAAAPAASFVNKKIKVVMRNRFQQNTLVKILAAHGAQVATDPKDKSSNIVLSDDLEIIDASLTTALFVEPAIDAMDAGYKNRGRLSFSIPTSRKQVRQLALALEMQDFTGFRAANRSLDRAQSFIEFRGLRALAVDDNTVNREVLVEALSSMGIEADTAINGEDALVKAKAQDYDVIFMDCSMPVMDGYTATRILRDGEKGTGKRIPIVAITALTERRGKDDWRHAGMDGWISKPFTIPSVAERITTLVLKHEATHLNASEMSDEEKLIAKFEVLPLLDEQTVSMIARLGSKGDSPAVRKIHDLFVTQSTQAIEKLNASNEDDLEEMATLAHMLQSVSLSIGAARVSRMAAHVEDDAKAGKAVPQSFLREMKNCQDLSAQAIAARFGVVNTKPRTTALKSA